MSAFLFPLGSEFHFKLSDFETVQFAPYHINSSVLDHVVDNWPAILVVVRITDVKAMRKEIVVPFYYTTCLKTQISELRSMESLRYTDTELEDIYIGVIEGEGLPKSLVERINLANRLEERYPHEHISRKAQ
tara:strand:+ start:149 stop:544 length:396 start_codon:yes stop_codon:yes gene_type:complete